MKILKKVREAIYKEGAGIIENFTYCTMATKCIGTFKPNSNANPYIGDKNKLEYVEEEKLEESNFVKGIRSNM